jgi:formyl-CoA transferase
MKEIAEEPALRATGTVVEVDPPDPRQVPERRQPDQDVRQRNRGDALSPCWASTPRKCCKQLGYSKDQIEELRAAKVI